MKYKSKDNQVLFVFEKKKTSCRDFRKMVELGLLKTFRKMRKQKS
jgi:hypothetical protein